MIGVIPAAGKAERFSGIYKETLPVHSGTHTCLQNAVSTAIQYGADNIVVVTTPEKVGIHTHLLRNNEVPISFVLQRGDELWGAIQSTFFRYEDSLLVMPDTVFDPVEALYREMEFQLGVFTTGHPERYSVLKDRVIYTKPHNFPSGVYKAWGIVYWSRHVIDLWQNRTYGHYDQAFNDAIHTFKLRTFAIDNYYDLGTIGHYQEYVLHGG